MKIFLKDFQKLTRKKSYALFWNEPNILQQELNDNHATSVIT